MIDRASETGLTEELLNQIVDLFREYNCTKVILYGSRATGDNTPTSDIDLAVSCEGEIGPLQVQLSELDTLLKFDVVDMNRVTEPLLSEILKNGRIIYEKI